jgi:hypothetical protein
MTKFKIRLLEFGYEIFRRRGIDHASPQNLKVDGDGR